MVPVPLSNDIPCNCFPREAACMASYMRIFVTLALAIFGIVGLAVEMGDESDKCSYWSLITTVLGFWIGSVTTLAINRNSRAQTQSDV